MQQLATKINHATSHAKSHNLLGQKITQPLGTKNHKTSLDNKKKSRDLSGQKKVTSWNVKNHAALRTKKSCNLMGQKTSGNLLGQK